MTTEERLQDASASHLKLIEDVKRGVVSPKSSTIKHLQWCKINEEVTTYTLEERYSIGSLVVTLDIDVEVQADGVHKIVAIGQTW